MALEAAAEAGSSGVTAGSEASSPKDGSCAPSTTTTTGAAARKGKLSFGRMDSMTQSKLDELQKELGRINESWQQIDWQSWKN